MSDDGARYIDFSAEAKRAIARQLGPLVEAGALIVRDEIVTVINTSRPAGRIYRLPGTKGKRRTPGGRIRRPKRRKNDAYGPLLPAGTYQASAPGQPPAERLAIYATSWQTTPAVVHENEVVATAFNPVRVGKKGDALGEVLEKGTKDGRLKPRPHIAPAIEQARPKLKTLGLEVRG